MAGAYVAPRFLTKTALAQPAPPAAFSPAQAQTLVQRPEHAPLIASYTLRARLDADRHLVSGSGTIVWNNPARVPARELYLHLYLNAFKNEKSLFLRSPFGAGRSGTRAHAFGYIDIEHLTARELGSVELWPPPVRHTPGDPDDETSLRVDLPGEIGPGQRLTLDVEFNAQLPEIVERTGYSGDYHFVAQWFPKLAKREPDGSWADFAFHAQSEFYADFGDYDITLDVPESMLVGATGVLVDTKHGPGRRQERYVARGVHDFAWTAWPGFREVRERITGIDVRLLYPPGNESNRDLTLESLRFALPLFQRQYGPYPYPALTVVHPPSGAENTGGMEYPT
ncbi:MAG TPA: M1 family peptidase, partial [Polyangiaceae bacterium]|nr:M1 family peptidase [Polyangiaceae bacterium]